MGRWRIVGNIGLLLAFVAAAWIVGKSGQRLPDASPPGGPPTLTFTPPPPTATQPPATLDLVIVSVNDLQPQPVLQPTAAPIIAAESTLVPTVLLPTFTPALVTYQAPPDNLNGIALDLILYMPESVRQNVRAIYAQGQALGRNRHAFSKLGDSTIENPHFLTRFDEGTYNLGPYNYLQPAIDYYRGSFERQGVTVRRGLHSWTVFDPMWADKTVCGPGENLIDCEIRLNNPSIIFVRLGSNDAGVPESFDRNLRRIVETSLINGVIPIMGTKADRHEGADNINNTIIRQIAADYNLPLWDFDLIAGTIPGRGLDEDAVHLTTYYAHDYGSSAAFQTGHGVHNLTGLMMLDAVWRVIAPIP